MARRCLVTGGAGFIGGHIVEALVALGDEVVVLDNLSSGDLSNIEAFVPHRVTFVKGDIADHKTLSHCLQGVDVVFHLAARISVPESLLKPIDYLKTNVEGTLNLLFAAKTAGVKQVVISSTAAIYGDNPVVPKLETMLPEPKSPYAVGKLDAEYYGQIYAERGGMQVACLRYFNVFGPRQNPNSAYAAAVPIFITKAMANEPLTIYGDGEQTRDFIYVKDVAAANLLAAEGASGVYNVAYSGATTINDIAHAILRLTHSSSNIIYASERPGDIKHSYADNQKIRQELDFKPKWTLATGLEQTIAAYQKAL